jgi:hypothetical protein
MVIEQISLVAVDYKDFLSGLPVGQDQGFVDVDTGEEFHRFILVFVKDLVKVFFYVMLLSVLHVVIAEKHQHPSRIKKAFKQIKGFGMGASNMLKIGVLPELVPVTDFHVGKVIFIIIIQCMIENVLVPPKFVGKAVISPVMIAEEDKLRLFVEGDGKGICKNLIQSCFGSHDI